MEKGRLEISYNGHFLEEVDAVIPRIGSSVTFQGAAVIQQFELMKVFTVARSYALVQARDKLRCMQKLASYGLDVPRSMFVGQGQQVEALINAIGGLPIIIKITESTHGSGVLLADTYHSASGIIEAFHRLKEKVMIQEYVKEASGTDIRVLVVAGKVVAAMKRSAAKGEFRSNLHRGASAITEQITARERELAVKATQIMGLDVAGVDLLRSSRGPLILEVNASPGLEGIENTTGVDVAGKIIAFIERKKSHSIKP
jgi:ribosomal protein S6--L-glutamate ligase